MSLKFQKHLELRKGLISDGWRTPDTYCKQFADIDAFPAVYLFLSTIDDAFEKSFVAYVGMSTNLRQRMAGHEVLSDLAGRGYHSMRWFKRISKADLRRVEASYIQKFCPPWNISGKPRGVIQ